MAASMGSVASLDNLPIAFSLGFLKNVTLSQKAMQTGFKYASEGYIHNISMFISPPDAVNVAAKCFRSQRKNESPHRINLDIGTSEITLAHCTCTAGLSGCCSHIVGLIQALCQWKMMGLTEPPADLSSTSLPQRWGVPRGQKIQPVSAPHMVIHKPKANRKRKPLTNTLKDSRNTSVTDEDIAHLQTLSGYPISYLASRPVSTVRTHLGTVPVGSGLSTQASIYLKGDIVPVSTLCGELQLPRKSLVSLSSNFKDKVPAFSLDMAYRIEENTREQAACPLWHQERKGRLTASNFHKIYQRKSAVTEKFVQSLSNPQPLSTEAVHYGRQTERKARELFVEKTGCHVHDCGLVINPDFSFLGASPDGKVCDEGKTGILEIKCPHSHRNSYLLTACDVATFCLENTNNELKLKRKHEYYSQIQGQLLVTGAPFCDFVVYTKVDIHIERIYPDTDILENMLQKLAEFYFSFLNK